MLAVTGKKISELYDDIRNEFGKRYMLEENYSFRPEKKAALLKMLMEDKKLPAFETEVDRTSYMDGCKVYFKNGGWVCVRFSGTEPLLRIFCEMPDKLLAERTADAFRSMLGIEE